MKLQGNAALTWSGRRRREISNRLQLAVGALAAVDDGLRWLVLVACEVGAPAALVVGLLASALLAGQSSRHHRAEPTPFRQSNAYLPTREDRTGVSSYDARRSWSARGGRGEHFGQHFAP